MNHISLFSGIGGFDLAAQWMGWNNVAHCEWNPFGQKVLKYYWPNAISYHDITKTDFTVHAGTIDILTGGFPCQPYSAAGKRKGKEDDRHLWPEMLRAIREIRPRYVVGENVRGLTDWNGGLVFDEVQADLENEGYEVTPFLLPACAVDAPHRRDRIWFVAYATGNRSNRTPDETGGTIGRSDGNETEQSTKRGEVRNVTNTNSSTKGSPGSGGKAKRNGRKNDDVQKSRGTSREFDSGRGEFLRPSSDTNNEERHGRSGSSEREWETPEQGRDGIFCAASRSGEIGTSTDTAGTGSGRELFEQSEQRESGRCDSGKVASDTRSEGHEGAAGQKSAEKEGKSDGQPSESDNVAIANTDSGRLEGAVTVGRDREHVERQSIPGTASNAFGFGRRENERIGNGKPNEFNQNGSPGNWSEFPTQSPICDGNDGISARLDTVAVFEGIGKPRHAYAFGKWRNESIKAGGNAIVPQVAHEIFKAIQQYENLLQNA